MGYLVPAHDLVRARAMARVGVRGRSRGRGRGRGSNHDLREVRAEAGVEVREADGCVFGQLALGDMGEVWGRYGGGMGGDVGEIWGRYGGDMGEIWVRPRVARRHRAAEISPLYLPCISPVSPLYLPYISPASSCCE